MTRTPTRNYSSSVVAASVASAAILALLIAVRLEIGVTGSANKGGRTSSCWTLRVAAWQTESAFEGE